MKADGWWFTCIRIMALVFALGFPALSPAQDEGIQSAAVPVRQSQLATEFWAYPLAPVPTDSPRDTILSFRWLVQDATQSLADAIALTEDDTSPFGNPEAKALKERAVENIERAASALDLSEVPPANRRTISMMSVLLLEEILDRITLPDLSTIPDQNAVASGTVAQGWTIPGTKIRLVRVEGEDGEANYLFSAQTVDDLLDSYEIVEALPKQSGNEFDLYQTFIRGPGLTTPIWVYSYILHFPQWALSPYFGQAIWQWIALTVLTLLLLAAITAVAYWNLQRNLSANPTKRAIQRIILPIVLIACLKIYDWILDEIVNLTGMVLAFEELMIIGLEVVIYAYLVILIAEVIANLIASSPRIKKESLDASLLKLLVRVLGFCMAGYVLFLGATRLGVPVYGVIAGLGVGGLAIALAVRPTLENFVGGIMLYADRPVKVGDLCRFGNTVGTVEDIGLRSTRLRSQDRTQVTIQNADFSQMSIINLSRRDKNLMSVTLSLSPTTRQETLEELIAALEQTMRADARVDPESVRVRFQGFADKALQVELKAYVMIADWDLFLKAQQELLFNVMKRIEDHHVTLAAHPA